jgi:hypothetical protein
VVGIGRQQAELGEDAGYVLFNGAFAYEQDTPDR